MNQENAPGRVERAVVEDYKAILKEPSRPPSKGGNTSAIHQHRLRIDGETYSFLARGARRWVFSGDVVSFDWKFDSTGTYRNVQVETFETTDKIGQSVERGDRRMKKQWRTATPRMPASRREQRD